MCAACPSKTHIKSSLYSNTAQYLFQTINAMLQSINKTSVELKFTETTEVSEAVEPADKETSAG